MYVTMYYFVGQVEGEPLEEERPQQHREGAPHRHVDQQVYPHQVPAVVEV